MSIVWIAVLVLVALVAPATAYAHVKWFIDAGNYPLRTDLVLGPPTALWFGASAVGLLWASLLQRMVDGADWPRLRLWNQLAPGGPTQLAVLAAIGLVSAAVRPALFAPNLVLPSGPFGLGVAAIELIVAATFVTGVADWLGALLLLGLVAIGVVLFSPLELVEQLHWVGVALVVLLVGRRANHCSSGRRTLWRRGQSATPLKLRRNQHERRVRASRALAMLRIFTGVAIIGAACEEKLWNPALGRAFLAAHPLFNVLHGLVGLPINDDAFVLLIGVAEGVLGVLLVSGLMTRLVVLGMWLPFNLGIPFLPPQELLGHLPIFGAMYLLLAHGPGVLVDWRSVVAWKNRAGAAGENSPAAPAARNAIWETQAVRYGMRSAARP